MKRNFFRICMILTVVCFPLLKVAGQDPTRLVATLKPASGSQVSGIVKFTKKGDDVQVVGDIQGLKLGKHGFHIHEKGDCSAPDASSAGAHYNPTKQHHGGLDTSERHLGDFGNIEADGSGKAHFEWTGKMKLTGEDSVLGKSVVVHEKEDDLKTDPSGNSGARISCGVIEVVK